MEFKPTNSYLLKTVLNYKPNLIFRIDLTLLLAGFFILSGFSIYTASVDCHLHDMQPDESGLLHHQNECCDNSTPAGSEKSNPDDECDTGMICCFTYNHFSNSDHAVISNNITSSIPPVKNLLFTADIKSGNFSLMNPEQVFRDIPIFLKNSSFLN